MNTLYHVCESKHCSCYSHPTCDANYGPLCWIQDLPCGWLGAFDPLVFGQVPGQGVSRKGDTALLVIPLLLWGSIPASVFTGRHNLPSGEIQSLRLFVWMRHDQNMHHNHKPYTGLSACVDQHRFHTRPPQISTWVSGKPLNHWPRTKTPPSFSKPARVNHCARRSPVCCDLTPLMFNCYWNAWEDKTQNT